MKYFKLLFFIGFFSVSSNLLANRVISADLTYTYVSGETYEFTLTVYRDCSVLSFLPSYYNVNYFSKSCNNTLGDFRVDFYDRKKLSAACPGKASFCDGGDQPGFEKYTYKGRFTIPQKCNDWRFYWIECNRASTITTLQNPGSTCIDVEATLNNKDFSGINSPKFTNDEYGFSCNGSRKLINLGVVGQNSGDNLVYSSVTPLSSFNISNGSQVPVSYASGFSASNPISSGNTFQINSSTGDIQFTPNRTGEKAVVSILIQQFRNNILVGSIMKDQQISVFGCVDPLISVTGLKTRFCANSPIHLDFYGSDPNGNRVNMQWNNGFSNGTFGTTNVYTSNQKATLDWIPSVNDIGVKTFTVTIKNDVCPIFGQRTYSYSFEVIAAPIVSLRQDTVVKCGVNYPLNSLVTNGVPPYTYKWNTGETTSNVSKPTGSYNLTVTDQNGCSGTDDVNLTSQISADFRTVSGTRFCIGASIPFIDNSFSNATITSWRWDFGNGQTATNVQNTSSIYTKSGTYSVKLSITDNNNCSQSMVKNITICDAPSLTLASMDSCTNSNFSFPIVGISTSCGIKSIVVNFGNGKSQTIDYNVNNITSVNETAQVVYDTTGVASGLIGSYTISATIYNLGSCTATKSVTAKVYPRPTFTSLSPLVTSIKCNSPITSLTGFATTTATGAIPPLRYTWSTGAINVNTITVGGIGIYTLTVIDARNCFNSVNFNYNNPITSSISVNKGYCKPGDSWKFNSSANSIWGIDSYKWDFGDTTFSPQPNTQKLYTKEKAYLVKYYARDASGCIDSSQSIQVLNALPMGKKIFPKDTCFGNTVTLPAPENNNVQGVLTSLNWKISNSNYPDTVKYQPSGSGTNNFTYTFERFGSNYISAKANYNYTCDSTFYDTLYVFKPVRDSISYNNKCAYLPTEFKAYSKSLDIKNTIKERTWRFIWILPNVYDSLLLKSTNGDTTIPYSSSNPNSNFSFSQPLNKHGSWTSEDTLLKEPFRPTNYYLYLKTIDNKGCTYTSDRFYFKNELVSQNKFSIDGFCLNEGISFINSEPVNTYNNILFQKSIWDVEEPIVTGSSNKFALVHRFTTAKSYNVSLTVFNEDLCEAKYQTTLNILPNPTANFKSDTVCLSSLMTLSSISIPASAGDSIIAYRWSLGVNSDSATTKNTSYKYPAAGSYTVTLRITNKTLCKDTVTRQVVVFPKPTANFIIATDINDQQSNKPIDFTDQTSFSDNIVNWKWIFTKKDSAVYAQATNTSHSFDSLGIYKISQIVTNNLGCSDTLNKRLDLNEYLILPNAFSPNNDSQNDELYLLYKGYKILKEFKIYNRFGEKVFDAGSDLNARWDGTQNGLPSPVGSYVYYVSATSIYNKDKSITGQLTLLR